MALLDGDTDVLVYPEVIAEDDYGNEKRVPSDTPVTIRALVQPSTSEELSQFGEVSWEVVRLLCRSFPAGPWAKVTVWGRDWDVLRAPLRRRYFPATSHDTVWIKARSPEAVTGG